MSHPTASSRLHPDEPSPLPPAARSSLSLGRLFTLTPTSPADLQVVWRPYGDEGMGFDSFICVESAQASTPVVLAPGEYWTGAMDVVP